jgi:hypothetical protein
MRLHGSFWLLVISMIKVVYMLPSVYTTTSADCKAQLATSCPTELTDLPAPPQASPLFQFYQPWSRESLAFLPMPSRLLSANPDFKLQRAASACSYTRVLSLVLLLSASKATSFWSTALPISSSSPAISCTSTGSMSHAFGPYPFALLIMQTIRITKLPPLLLLLVWPSWCAHLNASSLPPTTHRRPRSLSRLAIH